MTSDEYKSLLDKIAEAKNVEVKQDPAPVKSKDKDMPKKIAIIAIMVAIYGGLMAGLFISKNLIFLILVVAYVFACKPLLKGLQKLFKIKPKSDTQ